MVQEEDGEENLELDISGELCTGDIDIEVASNNDAN